MPNDNLALPAQESLEIEIEEAIRKILADTSIGESLGREDIRGALFEIFTRFTTNKDFSQRHRIINLIYEHKNKLLAKYNHNHPSTHPGLFSPALSDFNLDIVSTLSQKLLNDNEANSKNIVYEELYFGFLEILAKKEKALRKSLFLKMIEQIDSLDISFEDINKRIQSKYPGSKDLSYFAINRDLEKSEIDALIIKNLTKAQKRYYPENQPLTQDDLFSAIIRDDSHMIDHFANSSNSLSVALDYNKSTPLNYFAFLENYKDYSGLLQKNIPGGAAGVDDFITASRARIALGLSYSTDDFAGLFGFGYEHLMSIMLKDLKPFRDKETVEQSLECIKKQELTTLPNGQKIRVIEAPYTTHAAYFIVKYDKENNPIKISYCDGNLICDERFAEVSFNIDPRKLAGMNQRHGSLEEFLQRDFKDIYTDHEDLKNKFNNAISALVTCDKNNNPEISERNIPSKAQKRGNCAYKSMNIALRAVMKEIDPELTFEQDANGKGCGRGYEAFQHYKKGIINGSLQNALDCAQQEDFKDKIYHDQIIDTLKPAFLQAIRKGNCDLRDKITDIFTKEGVSLNDIKSEKDGNNALFFAVRSQNTDMINWCYDNDIKHEQNAKEQSPYHFVETREVAELLMSKEGKDIALEEQIEILDSIFGPKYPQTVIPRPEEETTPLQTPKAILARQ